ncbi:hypothetical protein JW979_02865 [bacterium]|nr:hypothetical protein [candidate division CSSED10-310 bacterium]
MKTFLIAIVLLGFVGFTGYGLADDVMQTTTGLQSEMKSDDTHPGQFIVNYLEPESGKMNMEIFLNNTTHPVDAFGFKLMLPDKGMKWAGIVFRDPVKQWQFVDHNDTGKIVIVGGFDLEKAVPQGKTQPFAVIYLDVDPDFKITEELQKTLFADLVDDIEGYQILFVKRDLKPEKSH